MAPPPEYDKEPKAPDKTATSNSTDDANLLHNLVNDLHANSDHKSSNSTATAEVENNKHVETLDDGQLRALLDEAITYKCPKDREGKSSLFKELLEEVEQDEQACEEAARTLSGCRGAGAGAGARRGGRGRRALPHSNSLQDLVAALAAEPAPRRHHVRHHQPAPQASTVAARATHGGSLPSGVDTSSLGEEPRGGYLATVHCVNPPPLAERRVSASDANAPSEMELLNRRSNKPMFPMTYTARATLEIGSGSVCSGRAVTTTTASNQVRTSPTAARARPAPRASARTPPEPVPVPATDNQMKLMYALRPKTCTQHVGDIEGGGSVQRKHDRRTDQLGKGKEEVPRGPTEAIRHIEKEEIHHESARKMKRNENLKCDQLWIDNVNNWYETLSPYERTNDWYNENCKHIKMNKTSELIENSQDNNALHDMSNVSNMEYSRKFSPNIGLETHTTNNRLDDNKMKRESLNNYSCVSNENKYRVIMDSTCDNEECDISLRKKYRKRLGQNLIAPTISLINPKNVRSMTIGQPPSIISDKKKIKNKKSKSNSLNIDTGENKTGILSDAIEIRNGDNPIVKIEQAEMTDSACEHVSKISNIPNKTHSSDVYLNTANVIEMLSIIKDIELSDVRCDYPTKDTNDAFSQYVAEQQKLFEALEATDLINDSVDVHTTDDQEIMSSSSTETVDDTTRSDDKNDMITETKTNHCCDGNNNNENCEQICSLQCDNLDLVTSESNEIALQLKENARVEASGDRCVLAELPNNAYVFLTLPQRLLAPLSGSDDKTVQLREIDNNSKEKAYVTESNVSKPAKKKKEMTPVGSTDSSYKKKDALDKNALKILLFENLFKSNVEKSLSGKPGVSSATDDEVDSAISFSCITTPEVVTSCNTTSSASQAAVAVDPKPRSVISSTFNGLPLSRPNYGAIAAAGADDYKKSLDENGNSVQGFSSPLSGSSQHKKPRRKKSSKNETVIDCQQIDGYQGDKDVNELLRFIESTAESARGAKLGRAKHKDDADDKAGKKRSAERRKDKESKVKRASSLEELSRTKLEDLTLSADRRRAPAEPQRRSWGEPRLEPDAPSAAELTDFQTVTKRRRPRRPPADRSSDTDSHSPPPAPPPPASYADIARTRHNIPDLIESCNFYAEGPPARAPPDHYPALERAKRARAPPGPGPAARPARPAPGAPDVVADRRPAVVLRLEPAQAPPQDMDGVTFGFDINEQLLASPRAPPRYVPPDPPHDTHLLLQIVDYVSAAWEDVVRCGGGKVRYFSE